MKEKCPAFKEKCPFDNPAAQKLKEQAKECPAFKDGCMFENVITIQDMYEKLSKMPDVTDGSPHQKALVEVLKLIHSVSNDLKGEIGECPAFSAKRGGIFKTLCADGEPLMKKLDNFVTETLITKSVVEVKNELENEISVAKGEVEKQAKEEKSADDKGIHLAEELKKGTMKVHRQAERVHFVKEFIKGRVEQKIYREAVASLYFIYQALEEEAEKNADHQLFKHIHFPKELSRVESLKEDLQFYYGDDWQDEIQMSDATKDYVDHIHDIGRKDPDLFISHHYTRYLGDLSGGQILKKMAVKAYELPENGDGVRFYEFKSIPDIVEFKNSYRAKLDNLEVDRETADKLVQEAQVSFSLNIKLFKELDSLAGFDEELVHEEVETIDSTVEQSSISDNKKDVQEKADHVTTVESEFDWLKATTAIVIVLAVLVAVGLNLYNSNHV